MPFYLKSSVAISEFLWGPLNQANDNNLFLKSINATIAVLQFILMINMNTKE